jgi:hypothetical protein
MYYHHGLCVGIQHPKKSKEATQGDFCGGKVIWAGNAPNCGYSSRTEITVRTHIQANHTMGFAECVHAHVIRRVQNNTRTLENEHFEREFKDLQNELLARDPKRTTSQEEAERNLLN